MATDKTDLTYFYFLCDLLEKECVKFCRKNNFDVKIDMGNEFVYYIEEKTVSVSILVDSRIDGYFLDNAYKMGLSYNCGDFILGFLHEIGHHFTLSDISRRQSIRINKTKERIDGWKKKDNYRYFQLLDERIATQWAINYINNNKETLREFANCIVPIIKELQKFIE